MPFPSTILGVILPLTILPFVKLEAQFSAKARFCRQHHFDAVFFDGQQYRFVVKKPTGTVDIFSLTFDKTSTRFTNFTHQESHNSIILQGGFYIDFAQLHVQFYYNDMISFESHEQLDFGAYGSSSCSFQGNRAPRIPKRNCNSKIHHKLLSPHLLTDYTPKHRVYLFEGESRLLWALIHQNPPYFGYVKLNSSKWKLSNCSQQWTFRSSLDTEHLYTGAFTFDKHIYVVQETISLNGFRYPNVVRQIKDLTQLTFTSYKMSLNQFFSCHESKSSSGEQEKAPDESLSFITSVLSILTSIFLGTFVLTLLIAVLVKQSNQRKFAELKHMLTRHKPFSPRRHKKSYKKKSIRRASQTASNTSRKKGSFNSLLVTRKDVSSSSHSRTVK